jgi:periplasmic protein TonB
MADRTARSIPRARVDSDHRPQLKLVAGARVGAPAGEAAALVAPATAPPILSQSADICGVGRGGWVAAALLYAALATALLLAAWQATPPEPWPASPAVFKVVFEQAAPALLPAPASEPQSVAPAAPPAPKVAEPEPAPPAPVAVAESTPPELPKPPPAKPAPPRQRAAPAPQSAAPAPSAPTEPQVATAAIAPPALPSAPVLPPQPISGLASNRKPDYPLVARQRGQQGVVVLRVEVSAAGVPLSVSVVSTSGYILLDKAALAAVEEWRFHPATQAGIPVMGIRDLPINFRLEE